MKYTITIISIILLAYTTFVWLQMKEVKKINDAKWKVMLEMSSPEAVKMFDTLVEKELSS